jgi:general secretion pathway protein K
MNIVTDRRQGGVALLVVLTIFALAASLAAVILYRQSHFRERTANLLNWDQRYQYALSVEAIAVQGLQMDLQQDVHNNQLVDSCAHEQWAVSIPSTPYKSALVSASVQDLQARFNLNWVVTTGKDGFIQNKTGISMLEGLLASTLSSPSKANQLAFEMADWSDSNNLVDDVYGAEDASYPLSRTPNMPIAHESEFRALLDMKQDDIGDPDFWQYLTALPIPSTLNVNDAPPKVLDAVFGAIPGLSGGSAAQAIIQLRQNAAITSIDQVMAVVPFSALAADVASDLRKYLSVDSHYFQVMVDVGIDGQYTRLVSRLQRPAQGQTAVYSREIVPRLGPLEPACNPVYNAGSDSSKSNNNKVGLVPTQ